MQQIAKRGIDELDAIDYSLLERCDNGGWKRLEFALDDLEVEGARAHEIVFTSGATESDNLAILGVGRINRDGQRRRIVTSAVEHKAVLLACKKLREEGFEVVFLPVDTEGRVQLDAAKQAIDQNTLLVSVQGANNETGTIQHRS